MSSGGATGSGSIATSAGGRGRQSQLFAGTGDMEDEKDQPFMNYVSEVDRILKDKFGKTDIEVGITSENMQEYADAQEVGQSPYEMAQDWIRNGETYRKNYDDATMDRHIVGLPLSRNASRGDGMDEDLGSPLSRNAPRGDGFIKGR